MDLFPDGSDDCDSKLKDKKLQDNDLQCVSHSLKDNVLPSSQESEFKTSTKRRCIRMNANMCEDHMETEDGILALKNPSSIEKSSLDPNRGLYPRKKSDLIFGPSSSKTDVNTGINFGFQSARNLVNTKLNVSCSASTYTSPTLEKRHTKNSCTAVQKNSLDGYFGKATVVSTEHMETCHEHEKPVSQQVDNQVKCSTATPSKSADEVVAMMFANQKKQDLMFKNAPKKRGKGKIQNKKSKSSGWRTSFSIQSLKSEASRSLNNSPTNETDDTEALIISQAQFGLLGGLELPEKKTTNDVNYFEILPFDILELIFCQLPMLDLCLNSNRVCKQWNNIICNEKFVPWKKMYYRLKSGQEGVASHMNMILRKWKISLVKDFLPELIRFMKDFKRVTSKNMLECLAKHKKYTWAVALLKERLQDCINDETPNPWCIIASLVIISETVHDIQQIIDCLMCGHSQCSTVEVLECCYCIATMLLTFKQIQKSGVWNSIHYRLYYALYLYENATSCSLHQLQNAFSSNKGQQSILQYSKSDNCIRLTHEQMRIVNHNISPGEVIKIVAFAGTGKTTTLAKYTQIRPSMRFLLVVYNRSMADHAQKTFPHNVTCKTGHSIAFAVVGRKYSAANKLAGNLRVKDVADSLVLKKGMNLYSRAKLVINTINCFCASADLFITTAHVPMSQREPNPSDIGHWKIVEVPHEHRMMVLHDAEQHWQRMHNLKDKMKMTHDGYLKVYQLSKPKLYKYDCILIDEAQDLTPAIADILMSQRQAKILVGDPRQQIYAFRGAVNSMQHVVASCIFYLTQSFRFGPEIAQVADCILGALHGEKKKTLVGSGIPGGIDGDQMGQLTIITRSNFTLFKEAVKKCCYSNEDIKVAFIGGADAFGFDTILDIHCLLLPEEERKKARPVQNYLIRLFRNLHELEKYASKVMDNELLGKIRIVKTFTTNLPSLISKILSKTINDEKTADVIFSTAHKAKGLEFNTVRLTDDFAVLPHNNPLLANFVQMEEDEKNILYVAATRAKKRLQLTSTLHMLMTLWGEKFDFPVLSNNLPMNDGKLKCSVTNTDFTPKALTLVRRSLKLADGTNTAGGIRSPCIVTESCDAFDQLFGLQDEDPRPEYQPNNQHRDLVEVVFPGVYMVNYF